LNTIGNISSEKYINTINKKDNKCNMEEIKDSLEQGKENELQDLDKLKKMALSNPRITELSQPEFY